MSFTIRTRVGKVGWGASLLLHLVGAAVAWATVAATLPPERPELAGRNPLANIELTAAWVEPDEPQPVEILPREQQVVVMPHRAQVARRTFFQTGTDVTRPTPAELAMVDRLTAAPHSQRRGSTAELSQMAGGSDVSRPPLLHRAAPVEVPASAAPLSVSRPQRATVAATDRDLPKLLSNPPPRYPIRARLDQLEGTVVLRVYVTAAGEVGSLEVFVSSGHAILDASAVRAVRSWRFLPATRAGGPVGRTIRLPVRFTLK